MSKDYFVKADSIVREIWGRADTILMIFGGASAEFALNKAVDWLFFTGKLPSDPLGRLFSTVEYARLIVFSELEAANRAIDKITAIHSSVERARGANIPEWAYRDVLYMLIDYSIRSYELLNRKLTRPEKDEVFDVFYRVGKRMNLKDLPENYDDWLISRERHLDSDLMKTEFSGELFRQYKKHLGFVRFEVLRAAQIMLLPVKVRILMNLSSWSWLFPAVPVYKLFKTVRIDSIIKGALFPPRYKERIFKLDVH